MSEFLDQYFETSNLNKNQETIDDQIEEVVEEQEEKVKEDWEEEETVKVEEFEEKEEEPTFVNASEYAEKKNEEQIEKEKEEIKGRGEEEKEKKHHCKDVLDENSNDIYNLFKVVIPYGDAVRIDLLRTSWFVLRVA